MVGVRSRQILNTRLPFAVRCAFLISHVPSNGKQQYFVKAQVRKGRNRMVCGPTAVNCVNDDPLWTKDMAEQRIRWKSIGRKGPNCRLLIPHSILFTEKKKKAVGCPVSQTHYLTTDISQRLKGSLSKEEKKGGGEKDRRKAEQGKVTRIAKSQEKREMEEKGMVHTGVTILVGVC